MNKILLAQTSDIASELGGMDSPLENLRQNMTIGSIISGLITWILVAACVLSLFFLLFGGIRWITSGGDKDKTSSGQKMITGAVIGLALTFATWAIFSLVLHFFGIGTSWSNSSNGAVIGPWMDAGAGLP